MRSSATISLLSGLILIACGGASGGDEFSGTSNDVVENRTNNNGNTNGNTNGVDAGGTNLNKGLDAGSLQVTKDSGPGPGVDAGSVSGDAATADGSIPVNPGIDSGSQGAGVCPSGNNVQIISQSGGGACSPTAPRFSDGHCSSPNDCGNACCACAGGGGFAVQACVGGVCVQGPAACACAKDNDFFGDLCQ